MSQFIEECWLNRVLTLMHDKLPTVYWSISCFDKRRDNPFPVYNRQLALNWDLLDSSQVSQVLQILSEGRKTSRTPSGLDRAIVSIQYSPSHPDEPFLAFRQYFIEFDEHELENRVGECTSFHCVSLNREYFEDENGNEISHYEMIQHVSGQKEPIIVGDADSILRLQLSNPKSNAGWSEKSANTIAQFLNVVQLIAASRWYRNPKTFTFEILCGEDSANFPDANNSTLLEAIFPNDSETVAVLAYFRQLHAADKLLVRACDVFVKTCSDERKNWWLTERKETFLSAVDSHPVPFTNSVTRRELIQMFMYGAGLLHAESRHGDDRKLAEFIRLHGKHRAVTAFNSCLWDILSIAISVYHVLKRDFDHWTGSCNLVGPTRLDIPTLFNDSLMDN